MLNGEIKTIIWDLDGTLIDSFGIFCEILTEILPAYQRQMPPEQIVRNNYHGSLGETINNILGGIEATELASIIEGFVKSQNSHYEIVEHHLFPDALDLAQRGHRAGMSQVVVTNRYHVGRLNASPRSIVERSSLKPLIDTVISGDDSEHHKPMPAVVASLLESGKIIPAETVVIGDQFIDAEFARNLGTRAILITRHEGQIAHIDRLGPDRDTYVQIVHSLSEVTL